VISMVLAQTRKVLQDVGFSLISPGWQGPSWTTGMTFTGFGIIVFSLFGGEIVVNGLRVVREGLTVVEAVVCGRVARTVVVLLVVLLEVVVGCVHHGELVVDDVWKGSP
jgi:hypothetical protein